MITIDEILKDDFDGEMNTAKAIMEYLGCECTYFPSMSDDDPITSAYSYAMRNSSEKGYIPMLIKPDETLFECLVINSYDTSCYFSKNTCEKSMGSICIPTFWKLE